ncbi:MAG TPA: folylpolyglutamate synthase/dihydrofolate synthase family protein [Synergistales bacterium]|nr:folylpolyglutamate synthase/dihydrofolate synthase family protein [Synergistota bacterium]HPE91107.1 folylpolyglutamate synthase/dihydrofolate synthase family protein [Synergistales bacterium]
MNRTIFGTSDPVEILLHEMSTPYIRPGLSRIAALLGKMGHPERSFPVVHVVGTNGKGSVSAMIEAIFLDAGYSTCLYTSPHLSDITERLRFSGTPIDRELLIASLKRIGSLQGEGMDPGSRSTYFEVLTAAAFDAIATYSPDVAVIEAGMGGRLDATNMARNVVLTVITTIGSDHAHFLGGTLEEIAMEKFRVLRPDGISVFSGRPFCLEGAYLDLCRRIGNDGETLRSVKISDPTIALEGNTFDISIRGTDPFSVRTSLGGTFQVENAALALLATKRLSSLYPRIDKKAMIGGLGKTRWSGRLERIDHHGREIVLDGAHNPEGIQALVETFNIMGTAQDHAVVFAVMRDKDLGGMVSRICNAFPMVVFTSIPGMERAACPDFLQEISRSFPGNCESLSVNDPIDALQVAFRRYRKVVVCGSLYLSGYLKRFLFPDRQGGMG